MRQHLLFGVCCLVLAACASGGGSPVIGGGGIGGGGSTVAPQPNIAFTVGPAPRAATGSNATPAVLASAGGPTLAAAAPGTAFALKQSPFTYVPESGSSGESATSKSGATLTILNAATGEARLTVPALGVSADFSGMGGYSFPGGRWHMLTHTSLQYVGFGNWFAEHLIVNAGTRAHYVMGYETPAAALPTAGTASYAGATSGFVALQDGLGGPVKGDATLNVDFSSATVTGSLTHMTAGETWNDVSLQGSIVAGAAISGTAAAISAPGTPRALNAGATGSLEGGFYGPTANEIGAVWTLHDGTNGATGVIGATRQ